MDILVGKIMFSQLERSLTMSYLPIVLRADNFPLINFRKLAANRNKKLYLLYLFLNMVKGVFSAFARKPQKNRILPIGNLREAALSV